MTMLSTSHAQPTLPEDVGEQDVEEDVEGEAVEHAHGVEVERTR